MSRSPLALAALVAILAASPALAADAASSEMPWETSFATALKKAETGKKPILFDFYTGWCPFCTKMEKTTWKDAGLIEAATKSFVVAKINADVEKVPVSRYRLVGFPTMIVASPAGEQIFRLEGYVDAAAMKRVLASYAQHGEAIGAAQATLQTDKKNVPALLTVASAQADAGLHDQAADTYAKAGKLAQGDDLQRANAGAGLALTRAGKADQAAKILAKALETAGASPSPALLLALGENEKALGHADKAKTWFDRLQSEHSGTPEAAAAKTAMGG